MPIKGDIQHSDLPDSLLHEPKGASTASAGSVYVANGSGSGSFRALAVADINLVTAYIANMTAPEFTTINEIDGSSLAQTADGVLSDVQAFVTVPEEVTNKINKNAKELYLIYDNFKTVISEIETDVTNLTSKVNDILLKLKTAGIVDAVEE